jgi:hypothetical protein
MTSIQITEAVKGIQYDNWNDRRLTKTRIYSDASEEEVKELTGMDRPPFTMKGEDPANDQAWKAYNRAEVKIMKAKIVKAFEGIKEFEGVTFKFSRTAGCSCGCSAGFVASELMRHVVETDEARNTFYLSSIYV